MYHVFRAPHSASIMSQYVGYAIRFFADLERSIVSIKIILISNYWPNVYLKK